MVTEGVDKEDGIERFFYSDGSWSPRSGLNADQGIENYLLSVYPVGTETSHVINGISRSPRKTECKYIKSGHWSCSLSIKYFMKIKEGYFGEIIKIEKSKFLVNQMVCIDILGVGKLEKFQVSHTGDGDVCQ